MLIVNKHILNTDVEDVLATLLSDLKAKGIHYLRVLKPNGNNIQVCCPYHNEGREHNPSAGILTTRVGNKEAGTFHCFACHRVATLTELISHVFGRDDGGKYGETWLFENFGATTTVARKDELINTLPKIFQTLTEGFKEAPDSSILDNYRYTHEYMYKRHLTDEVIDLFDVGYDKDTESITFPCCDEQGVFRFITRRSINGKLYNMPRGIDKVVYGLNKIPPGTRRIYVCESIINALTLWGWGYYAVALLGTGTTRQYDILNKYNTRKYILCFDGDEAGDRATQRFKQNVRGKLIEEVVLPRNKDINDLTLEQFKKLERRGI